MENHWILIGLVYLFLMLLSWAFIYGAAEVSSDETESEFTDLDDGDRDSRGKDTEIDL
jgi:hypothetical protein